jgi:hypothetical protein
MDSSGNSSQFVSLIELLDSQPHITVGQIATAIEKGGVYGWDQYGRFGKSDSKNAIAKDALIALEDLWSAMRAWQVDPKNWDPEEGWFDEFPLNDLCIDGSHPLHFFGWPNSEKPRFEATEDPESALRPALQRVSTTALYNIIGALLGVVSTKRERPMTEAQLINQLLERHPAAYGISKSNLEKQFSLAKKNLASDT